jgi:hypothetical protein
LNTVLLFPYSLTTRIPYYPPGLIFWFTRKKLVGSYSCLMAASRS